ncbi:AAA family ATPase [Streptomyces sp. B1866]|uniref:AAA family ATPase n=1 Tax=Streptomyces sp. B1866 TaxID=3075431 RepID=UPI00288DBC87|nr:AAA family ATPase [Streptomyces sp. B1866]MDT3400646.1 AAA family ATPase [Streptomyces sp. B1866]
MYVAKLRIDGVRGFRGPRSVDLDFTRPDGSHAGWTVLAGRNGSGKTTLLRAVALCLMGPPRAPQLEESPEGWLPEDQDTGHVSVDVLRDPIWDISDSDEIRHPVSLDWLTEPLPVAPQDEALFPPPARRRLVSGGFKGTPEIESALWRGDPYPGWFVAAYGPFRRLSGGDDEQPPQRVAAVRTLFHEKAALSEAVSWLTRLHLARLEKREGAADLIDATFELLRDGLLPDGYQAGHIDSEGLWLRNEKTGQTAPLQQMSDGYRTVVALVLDIVRRMFETYRYFAPFDIAHQNDVPTLRQPGIVLIDEVEAHLHVSWQQRIGPWLKSHFPNVQFLVTTHSPYICQAADENGLIRMPGPAEEVPPAAVSPDLYRRVVYGTGDDSAVSELFGLDSPYSESARELRRQLVELESAVVRGQATAAELERLRALKRTLSSSPVTRVDEISARLLAAPAPEE